MAHLALSWLPRSHFQRPVTELNPLVVTATRSEHNLAEASAPVSVVSAEQIKAKGASNLLEALRGVSGVSLNGRQVGGRKTLSIRGAEEAEADDPILSVVNLIDVFLLIIAALLLAVASNPFSPVNNDDVTLIKNPGKADMEILVKEGETLAHYKSSGEIGQGEGAKAGIAYRLKDGSMLYVPE